MDEYTPAGALVQSIAMPTATKGAQNSFVLEAGYPEQDLMTRSTNEEYLVAMGFDAAVGGETVTSEVPRVIARIGSSGEPDTTTSMSNFAKEAGAGTLKGIASVNGSRFWVAGGTSYFVATETGEWTAAYGATTATQVATLGFRAVGIFEGQLFGEKSEGLYSVGNRAADGIWTDPDGPAGGSHEQEIRPILFHEPQRNALCRGRNHRTGVIRKYVDSAGPAEKFTGTLTAKSKVITKVSSETGLSTGEELKGTGIKSGTRIVSFKSASEIEMSTEAEKAESAESIEGVGGWVEKGSVSAPTASGLDLRGLTGKTEGENVTLYATMTGYSTSGGGKIVTLTDSSGFTGTLSGSMTVLATAATKEEFRGIAFAPVGAPTVPGAPLEVTATGGEHSATVTWSPPSVLGGRPISGYTVKAVRQEGGGEVTHELAASARSYTFTGLENGVAYDLSVSASNEVGPGPFASASGNPVTPAPTPPEQPLNGPGGSATPWGGAELIDHPNSGSCPTNSSAEDCGYWIVKPKEWRGNGPAPTSLSVTVFLHGYGAAEPHYDEFWMKHLAEEGNYVIFPLYEDFLTLDPYWTDITINAIKKGLEVGKTEALKPEPSLGMNLIGWSAGGSVAAAVANYAVAEGLPTPRSLLLANPYNGVDSIFDYDSLDFNGHEEELKHFSSFTGVPASMRVACVVGNQDEIVGRTGCDRIWGLIPQVTNKQYIWMSSDYHGSPALVANHYAPGDSLTGPEGRALDYYGYWKLGDALEDCSTYATNCAYLEAPLEEYMGTWSDGVPVHPLSVTNQVPSCPAGNEVLGCTMEPLNVSATAGRSSVTVKWTKPKGEPTPFPEDNPFVGYVVTARPTTGGEAVTQEFLVLATEFSSFATEKTLTGLTPGVKYDVSVAAVNAWHSEAPDTTNAPAEASTNPVTPLKSEFTIEKLQKIHGEASYTKSKLTAEIGDAVEYEVIVKNTGNVALKFQPLSDPAVRQSRRTAKRPSPRTAKRPTPAATN